MTKFKPSAPFLLYLYYAFNSRPLWFRRLWRVSDWIRRVVLRMSDGMRYATSQVLSALICWPLARAAKLFEALGFSVSSLQLSAYRGCGFYVMRTDALDRFVTRLEQDFTKADIKLRMDSAGLENIKFSDERPFWCAVGYRKAGV